QRDHRQAAQAHRPAKKNVGDFADLPLQQRRRSGFDFQVGPRTPLRFGSVETRPGQSLIGHSVLRVPERCYKSVKKWGRAGRHPAPPPSRLTGEAAVSPPNTHHELAPPAPFVRILIVDIVTPMPTFAAIDIGSNSVRLKIARLQAGRLKEVHEDREVTRLGEGVFSGGQLSPEAMAETVRVLRRFHRATQECGTDSVRVVATAALRDARNSRAFLEWVRSTTGWNVDIISGLEEARLIHLGLVSTLRCNTSPVLMADLGGGSCELTVSSEGHIRNTVSLPLGAVRLTNEFLRHDPPRKSEMRQLRGFIFREIERTADRIKRARPKVVIATSGTAESLAAVCHGLYKTKGSRAATVSKTQMRRIAKLLARLPLEGRKKLSGVGP